METDEKACPFCAETVKVAAVVCKHCGKDIRDNQVTATTGTKARKIPMSFLPIIPPILLGALIQIVINLNSFPGGGNGFGVLIGFLGALLFLSKYIGTSALLTDRQVIFKRGIISMDSVEIQLDKIDSIVIKQSIMGRFLGYGLILIGGGSETKTPIPYAKNPYKTRDDILQMAEAAKRF